jgi:FkbM family methyltransferase
MKPYQNIPVLWDRLAEKPRTVVLYGMGNGADKILDICEQKGIVVSDVFASDSFVRGQIFHGRRVLSWSEVKQTYGTEYLTVLLSFGSSLPEVLDNIQKIANEAELLAPDVPAFGDTLFDRAFLDAHIDEVMQVREMLADDESRRIFDLVIEYKLSGNIKPLLAARSDPDEVMRSLVRPSELTCTADLGAYNGDSIRELLSCGARPKRIYAMEPDRRNFKKLSIYAEGETRTEVLPTQAAAWSRRETLTFDASGNRNASAESNRSRILSDRPAKTVELSADTLDNLVGTDRLDYIKYDVEGSEKEALIGSSETILRSYPTLLVSLYHRSEDLFALPLLIRQRFPDYNRFYLRRFGGVPAWDLNLYVRKE